MPLLVFTVAAGVVAGWLRGGRVRNIGSASVRGALIAAAAVVAQAVHAVLPQPEVALAMTALSQLLLLVFLWLNRFAAGAFLIAAGSTLNAAVILANGAMPVSRGAIMAVARHPRRPAAAAGRHHRPAAAAHRGERRRRGAGGRGRPARDVADAPSGPARWPTRG
jgi:hypothetical protein